MAWLDFYDMQICNFLLNNYLKVLKIINHPFISPRNLYQVILPPKITHIPPFFNTRKIGICTTYNQQKKHNISILNSKKKPRTIEAKFI
ncbi:hypothetical protein FPG101_05445 [Flavobacterium psychrophilum FPG101]|nr:hypothetical protein FPG101_05445 [Flavobacterium psychrophilum FPG101]